MTIKIVGSLAHDRIMDFPGYFKDRILPEKIHSLSVSFAVDTLLERRGGTAGNIAYTLALLGEKPELIASVGKDYAESLAALRSLGVSTKSVEVYADSLSACATIITDRANNQITGFFAGAMERETAFPVSKSSATVYVIAAANPADMLRYAQECRKQGIPTLIDPGQQIGVFSADKLHALIEGAAFLALNDYEHTVLLSKLNLLEDDLLNLVDTLIVTFGGKGSLIKHGAEIVHVPACAVANVLDPTGAGDAFRAGFLKGYALGCSLEQMGRLASTAASFVIEAVGTQEHHFTQKEFSKRYAENYSEPCPIS